MRLIAITLAGIICAATAGTAASGERLAGARTTARANPVTYVVTPTGTGAQSLQYVLTNLAQPNDVVELSDGVYQVGELDVTTPGITVRALNLPAPTDTAPHAWLDGTIPYRYWSHPAPNLWTHPYNKDFCAETLRNLPCNQLSVSYHADEMFSNGAPVPQTIHPADLSNVAKPVFFIATGTHSVVTNFDPGATTAMTEQETALAFEPSAVGATFEGIGVRGYAGNDHDHGALAMQQDSAVFVNDASNVAFRYDWFSFNGLRALKTQGDVPPSQTPVAGSGIVIDHSVFDHNGELGLDAVDSDGIAVTNTLFYRNNWEGFAIEPGAAKLLSTYNASFVGNVFTANNGIGLWFDRSSYNEYVAHNTFLANAWHGMMIEISARAVITSNIFDGNAHIAMLILEASNISFSHNVLIGNLEGIRISENYRTLANFPSGHDADPDRIMPSAITFNVSSIDIHSNDFYYYPAHSPGLVCNTNPNAIPTESQPDPFSGCQYMIAAWAGYAQDANTLGVLARYDNFHTRNWPAAPTALPVPLYTALWYNAHGCAGSSTGVTAYRWSTLGDFQCTGQEAGGHTVF